MSRAPLQLPDQVDKRGILVGWSLEHELRSPPIGFHYGSDRFTPARGFLNPVLFEGEGHLMTIAPTGSGKGTGCIIPTLLRHEGPVIVIDPKGENAAVAARQRKQLGQQVAILDPLGIGAGETDRLNPFDLLDKDSASLTDDVAMLMNILTPETIAARDQFWVSRAEQLLIGLTLHLIVDHGPEHHHLGALRKLVYQDHKKLLQIGESMDRSQHPDVRAIASNVRIPAPETFGGILSYAQQALGFMRGDLVQAATRDSTVSFDAITRGDPLSLFLLIPSDKLESHGPLLKIWVGSLIAAIARRQAAPPKPTLFILDEAAQLGPLPQLRQAITLLRGYGLQTWSFWQDVSQLQRLYPYDWETMVNNCKVLQTFGANNMNAARTMASLTGYPRPWELLDLDYNEMILLIGGDEAVIAQRPDYLKDPLFRGMFDDNPRHDREREILPAPRKPQRIFTRPPQPIRVPAGDPLHPPEPLWSEWERNAMDEVIGVRRLEGKRLRDAITVGFADRRSADWPIPPLIAGDWRELNHPEATRCLVGIWPRLSPSFGYGLTSIDEVRAMPLSFYREAHLCEARCHDAEGFVGYLTWIDSLPSKVHLTGTAPPIHQLNSMLTPQLEEAETAARYLEFFCAAVHAEAGPFRVIQSPDDLRFASGEGEPPSLTGEVLEHLERRQLSRPMSGGEHEESVTPSARWGASCVVQYGPALYRTGFVIREDGFVEMTSDEQIAVLPDLVIERFEGGVRTDFVPVRKDG